MLLQVVYQIAESLRSIRNNPRNTIRLYCEEIDIGEAEPRLIASGLVPHYSLDAMSGRRVVVMCNLKVT